jgi:LysM repeat protein
MVHTKIGTAALAAAALASAFAASAQAQTLKGSQASVDRMYSFAVNNNFDFFGTAAAVKTATSTGKLVALASSTADYELHEVQYPFVKPEVKLFVERLSSQYRAACGERMVVTSAVRPMNMKLRNASELSVHGTGMAVDIRSSKIAPKCKSWLRTTLLSLEKSGVLEATEEILTPHFHVALYPAPYTSYLGAQGHAVAVSAQSSAESPQSTEMVVVSYQVRSGDSLWRIAVKHDTSVSALQDANNLRGSTIHPGQVILVPTQVPQQPR